MMDLVPMGGLGQFTTKEPADRVVTVSGSVAPPPEAQGVINITELAVAKGFVIVVLEPVAVTSPHAFGLMPEDVEAVPSQ